MVSVNSILQTTKPNLRAKGNGECWLDQVNWEKKRIIENLGRQGGGIRIEFSSNWTSEGGQEGRKTQGQRKKFWGPRRGNEIPIFRFLNQIFQDRNRENEKYRKKEWQWGSKWIKRLRNRKFRVGSERVHKIFKKYSKLTPFPKWKHDDHY